MSFDALNSRRSPPPDAPELASLARVGHIDLERPTASRARLEDSPFVAQAHRVAVATPRIRLGARRGRGAFW